MKKQAKKLPDTNTIVRYLVADEPALYARSKAFFESVKTGSSKAVVLESVVAECVYVLTKIYKVPRDIAALSLIDMLRYKGVVNSDKQELINALMLFSEKSLDIVDCILLSKSLSGVELFTFDDEMNKLLKKSKI